MTQAPRLRIPLAPEYANALGVATYCFAICEWNVVWCCERIGAGSLNKFISEEKTAGQIGRAFGNLVRNMKPSSLREELASLVTEFLRLVDVRNGIIHGKPGTAKDGEQRLFNGNALDITDLERAADEFAACSSALNAVLHGALKEPL